jgi:3-hydroxyisobutyrate dehydrogenase
MRIGFVGIGRMGEPMVLRLLGAGLNVAVWNRTRGKLASVLAAGARSAEDLVQLTDQSDVVLTMVTDDTAVRDVYLDAKGLLTGNTPGKLFVDMSTILPATVKQVAASVEARGGFFVDAPVAGTVQPAREGRLLIFAGGSAVHVQTLKPAFDAMARRVEYLGPVGSGSAMKLLHNALLATQWAVLAESLAMGSRYGLDLKRMLDVIGESPASFAALAVKIPLILGQPAEIGFNITNVRKDLRTIATFAESLNVPIPVAAAALETFHHAVESGLGGEDVASIVKNRPDHPAR